MSNFIVNTADLYYILKQIKISEKTSQGYTSNPITILQAIMNEYGVSAANASQLPAGLRTVDGSFNNLFVAPNGTGAGSSEFGAADNIFPRLTDPVYMNDRDGDSISFGPGAPTLTNTNYAGALSVVDADPRIISNLIVDMSAGNPAAVEVALGRLGITGAAASEIRDAIVAANAGHPAAVAATAAAQSAETAAQAALVGETSQRAAAVLAAADAASALDSASAVVAQDVIDLEGAVAASEAADAALAEAQVAKSDALVAQGIAQAAYDAALAAVGTGAEALADAGAIVTAATDAHALTVQAVTEAQSAANAAQAAEQIAADAVLAALGIQSDAQDAVTAADVALGLADNAVIEAETALAAATVLSDEANAALALVLVDEQTASNLLNATTNFYNDAVAANQPTATALATAVTVLASATTAQADAAVALTDASANAIALQLLENAAVLDLPIKQGEQVAAQQEADAAAVLLAAYDEALALDVGVKASATSADLGALVFSLPAEGEAIDATVIDALDAVIAYAQSASEAAEAAEAALQVPGVSQEDLDYAAATASGAAQLLTDLGGLRTALADLIMDEGDFALATAANDSATAVAGLASASSNGMADVSQPAAADRVALADQALINADIALALAVDTLATATLNSDNADLALGLAQTAAETAQAALAAAQTAHADAVIANEPTATALALAGEELLIAQAAYDTAVENTAAAQAIADTAQGVVDAANETLAAKQQAQVLASEALASAGQALVTATSGVTSAQAALTAAAGASDAADAALGTAQGAEADAQIALDGAIAAYDAVVTANGPLGTALTTATANLAAANAALADSDTALTAAIAAADAKQGLEVAASNDLAASQAVETAAAQANTLAQAALETANGEFAAAQIAAANATEASDAADAAAGHLEALLTEHGIEHDQAGSLIILNLSPDVGLTAGFNSWMTYFGQFFDHGLDLVTKGGAGTVYIPLQNDDPLVAGADGLFNTADDLPSHMRFMALTRATQTVGADGIPQHTNTTTSFVDQNQTYTSHASHQVFLREYKKVDLAGDGLGAVAVSTGKLLDGTTATGSVDGAIGTWADVKAQALEMLGIRLGDYDVHKVPLLLTDQYGKFIPGANGYAQLVMAPDATHATNWLKEGTAEGITTAGSISAGAAFLDDIAHHAAPAMVDHDRNPATARLSQTADVDVDRNGDGIISAAEMVADDGNALTYDDELLNSHFITGDGRGNENIALTAVHSIFHSEHNRTVEANKVTILATAAAGGEEGLAFLNEWLLVDVTEVPANPSSLVWDGERMFQAARFSTEMQYQHMVFEEFARRIQPMVDPFVFNNSPEIDASILAEFAHTVYRFGHSMLTGTVDRLENDLTTVNDDADQASLLAVFLNPQAYVGSGATLEEINANLVRGLSRDTGSHIDEFIVTDVRSNLLGLPLDLGALNIARGRDTGIPSLNETRKQLYDDYALADLKPYESWADFAQNIKNAASIINFIAAYGTHSTITSETTMAGKRAAAEAIVFGGADAPADRLDFIHATGAFAGGKLGGLNDVDLWIGGLAEANPEFGGMLGTTFNFVFELQMELLQNGDRLYYLTRTQGQNILFQLEGNTFADMIMRNTALGDEHATHLSGQLFLTPDLTLELDRGIAQEDYNGALDGLDPIFADDEPHSLLDQKVTRTYSGVTIDGHDVGGTLRFRGGEHVVLGGTEGDDKLYGDLGDDTLWGDGGNDYLNGGTAADEVFGGTGDDIIEDPFGDDILRGQAGNDVITSSRGFDIMFGNEGSDVIILGQDASEVFAGQGDDFILGGAGSDALFGNEGDDWIEGGAGFDGIAGDNSELFFNSSIVGHDVMFAHQDESDYDAESGDDIMGSGASVYRYEGMYGFDWAIAKGDNAGVAFDMAIKVFANEGDDILRDRFDAVEALSGYTFDDVLEGDDRGRTHIGDEAGPTNDATFLNDILNQEGIDRIHGFSDWMAGARETLFGGDTPLVGGSEVETSYRDGNILIGGDGSDTLRGRGGFDLIDGDAYLNVRIGINLDGVYYSAESLNTDKTVAGQYAGRVYAMVGNDPNGEVDFAAGPVFDGRSLTSLLLDRTINPGQMSIVREIKHDATDVTGAAMDIDTAVYFGTLAEYDIEGREVNLNGVEISRAHDVDGDGFIAIRDLDDGDIGATVNGVVLPSRKLETDNVDLIRNIEQLRFSDQTLVIAGPGLVRGPSVDLHGFDAVITQTAQYLDSFTALTLNGTDGVTPWTTTWVETNDGTNAMTTGQIQTNAGETEAMRFIAGDGATITRAISLDPTVNTTLSYVYSFSGIDTGDNLTVQFAANGNDWVTIHSITGAVANNANLGPTLASFSVNGTANSALRFTVSTLTDIEGIRIDDVSFVSSVAELVPVADGTGFEATFTEDGAAVAIASLASITDPDNATLLSAQVRLTNAQALDVLTINGALPTGIASTIDTSVPGQITINLTGAASKAAYQAAVQAVRFSNSSQSPDTTPRNVEVRATSADGTSPVAIATVTVVSVNDAPVTVADAIVTNISSGSIIVPEWALLKNDSDIEGALLDVTAVAGATGVIGLSLASNPGSVTFVDDGVAGGSFSYTANDGGPGGTTLGAVTMTNTGYSSVADNFNGANNNVRSAANNSTGAVAWTSSWTEADDDAALLTGQIQIDAGALPGTNQLRFGVGDGGSISRVVNLSGVTAATLSLSFDKNNIDVGESVAVQFAADGVNFVTLNTITNTNNTVANGNAAGTLSLNLTGALGADSTIRFVGSGINTAGEDIRIDNVAVSYAAANANVNAAAGNQILVGNNAGSTFSGGAGDDTVFANGGDDVITWSVGHGRDFIDGGANGTEGDRFIINGDNSVEAFVVYARAEAIAAGHTDLNGATEIVVTRNNVVVGELDNVEEITINTGAGADTVAAVGDFGPTSLFFNTITVNGQGGRDTIDASRLTSAHKLVLTGSATAASGAMTAVEAIGFAGQSVMMRKARYEVDDFGILDTGALSHHGGYASFQGGFASGGKFNPMFDRAPALDDGAYATGQVPTIENSALHSIAADYLII